MMIITEQAKAKINEILDTESPNYFLRVYVQGGGCSGFQYGFMIDDTKSEDDLAFECGARSVQVDAMSYEYLRDAVVDFKDGLSGACFAVNNPQAASTCGCGSSFSV